MMDDLARVQQDPVRSAYCSQKLLCQVLFIIIYYPGIYQMAKVYNGVDVVPPRRWVKCYVHPS